MNQIYNTIMKRFVVLLLSVMLAVMTYGQNNDDKVKEVYALITIYSANSKAEAKIDFGDGTKAMFFADDNGSRRKFVSFFEPINMLIKDGWRIEHYTPFIAGTCQVIINKKVKEESQVKEGMKLKEE